MCAVYFCKKLAKKIELPRERLAHIQVRHPELKDLTNELDLTISNPELILLKQTGEILFIHWFQHVLNGKFLTVVVIKDDSPERNWIITAFITRKLPKGDLYE